MIGEKSLGQRIFDGLLSTGVVYLLSPTLLSVLAPLQAQLNAGAASKGQNPSNFGVSSIANLLLTPPTPPATTTIPATTVTPSATPPPPGSANAPAQ